MQVTRVSSEVEVLLQSSEAAGDGAGDLASAQCSICIEELAADGGVTVLPGCLHAFHSSCIGEWFNRAATPTCPYCRRDMTKQRTYMRVLAAIESHERRRSEVGAAGMADAQPVRRHWRLRRASPYSARRVTQSDGGQQRQGQIPPGVHFSPVVLTPLDDAPLFEFVPYTQ
ncbi:unnamed protein product [Alopecurus aequalis]